MADYYRLIARAVASLDNSTRKSRCALYERARAALLTELRQSDPSFGESEITSEYQSLEDAIRRVEAEFINQSRRAGRQEIEPQRAQPERQHMQAEPPSASVVAEVPELVRLVGLPGDFMAWGLGLVRQALEAQDVTVVVEPSDTPELPGTRGVRVVLVDALKLPPDPEEAGPTVIFFDDPLQVLDSLLSVVGDAVTAIRGLTAALSRLAVIRRTPETLLIDRAAIGDSSASLRAVTTHLLPRPSRRLPAPLPLPHPRPLKLVPEVITIGQQVLQPMAGLIRGVTSGPIVWPRTCFYDGSRPDQAVPAEIEVAGPARTLVYGPYFYLPPGTWRITALLSFSEYACTNSYMMDVFTDVQLAKVQLCPPDDGEWMASWMFENTHWQRQIEVRLFVERGAIEGRVALRQVNLEPLGNSE